MGSGLNGWEWGFGWGSSTRGSRSLKILGMVEPNRESAILLGSRPSMDVEASSS